MTVSGRISGSDRVVFSPPDVSPSTGVSSEPAYVVGTTRCWMPSREATALPSPGGRATADRDHRISLMTADDLERLLGHLDRSMRHGAGELADRPRADQNGHPLGQLRVTAAY